MSMRPVCRIMLSVVRITKYRDPANIGVYIHYAFTPFDNNILHEQYSYNLYAFDVHTQCNTEYYTLCTCVICLMIVCKINVIYVMCFRSLYVCSYKMKFAAIIIATFLTYVSADEYK